MKVMSIFGTRPEMIKLWSTLRLLDTTNFEHIMVHTGQNFAPELKEFFFRDLEMRAPDFQLQIDTSSYGREVADVIAQADDLLVRTRPDALLVLGDTYSGLAVMPAAHRGVRILHMEAGLRAWDVRMPEQRNRILIDHLSNVLLPFNHYHRENLIRENIHPSKIFVTGNPTFEVMRAFQPRIRDSDVLRRFELTPKQYFVVTAHRSENVDHPANLQAILDALGTLHARTKQPVIYPMHPRTKSKLDGVSVPRGLRVIAPLGFYDFQRLQMDSACIISDSGTAPEESLFYRVPCVSLRQTTERPETVEAGAHIVAGLDPENIVAAVTTATQLPWNGRYELEENFAPSQVVVNVLRSQVTNYF